MSTQNRTVRCGIFCSYTPTARTRRTLASTFPFALSISVSGYAPFMIGSNEPIRFDQRAILERLKSKPVRAYLRKTGHRKAVSRMLRRYLERATVAEIGPEQRTAYLGGGDINTDLFPRDEFDKSISREGN